MSDEHQSDDPDQLGRALNLEAVLSTMLPELADVVMIGKFEAFACIGRGGFGLVYLARDPTLGRVVAVKWCPDPASEMIERFQREAKILARFSHPNIVTLHEVGWHGKDFFYAMEFVEGCDGAKYISSKPDWREALKVYEAAATGLAAAHAKGIVHADFKPANVLVGSDGRVRVADFGLAQSIGLANREDDSELSGPWAGTLPYMAPELWAGAQPNASTDQFALCVSLWETLYGRRPFEGKTPMALFGAMTSSKPRVPWGAPALPRGLLELLLRGLAVEPNERFPSMAALIEALAEIRTPMLALQVPASTSIATARSWVPYIQGAAVALVLGSSLVLAVLGWMDRARVGSHDTPQRREAPPLDATEPPCALGDEDLSSVELDATVVAICQFIRDGHFRQAHEAWDEEHLRRLIANEAGLGEQALIIARTFVEEAEAIHKVKPTEAWAAASYAKVWLQQAAPLLSESDVVGDLRDRAEVFDSPGSTTSD